ncbi:MAG: DUF2249 domain-containing protein [Deltaproteobacteria bacterium]|jgi:uncharacterized protein (DUF2249 family)|nr:DUF2249 domain-containing protein [Deltaproteobacteria bacterium]MCL5880752.1 DUF2249 domain-containing protein [Deltaproteobacteria bacterium]MDA8304218.1 DUF2249 domain-containing protein [Deltaproteobacteria bacterium]
MENINNLKRIKLDVREDIKSGADPFQRIMKAVNELKEDEALDLTNSFEPFPLYSVLKNKGFEHITNKTREGFQIIFFRDKTGKKPIKVSDEADEKNFTDEDLKDLAHKKGVEIDVRGLEPPQPLLKIFETLENIKADEALYITHERKPIHLYPRLKDAGYKFLTEETGEDLYTIKVWR